MEVETIPQLPEPSTSTDTTSRLGLCEVCAFKEGRYTCPRCEVKTCSLRCNKIHKLEVECTGERDRTKFIPINKFTNLDLSSDYRLLEEITRSIETSRKKFGRVPKFDLPYKLIQLKNGAAARNTILKFLPDEFVRHKNNTTYFDQKQNLILWHLEWIFVNADFLKFTNTLVPETNKINSVLDEYFVKQEDSVLQEKMQYYQSVGVSGVKVLLKAEMKRGKKFYELDPTMTIKECLKNKTIIEYPTIYVVFKDHGHDFETIDSDDEEDVKGEIQKQVKSGAQVVDSIIKHGESNESLYNSLKNLLFISEYSDEEPEGGNDSRDV